MFDPEFHPNRARWDPQHSRTRSTRHGILLEAYMARRRERLANEQQASLAAQRMALASRAISLVSTATARLAAFGRATFASREGFECSSGRNSRTAMGD